MPDSPRSRKTGTSDLRCPMCGLVVKNFKTLSKHLKRVTHTAVFTTVFGKAMTPLLSVPQVNQQVPAQQRGMTTCRICGVPVKRVNVARHLRSVHKEKLSVIRYPSRRSKTKVPSANIPSSLSRMPLFPRPRRRRAEDESKSVWTVSGGLPDTDRSRH
jgi:uncharacterized C2H2 Zn-finger protein